MIAHRRFARLALADGRQAFTMGETPQPPPQAFVELVDGAALVLTAAPWAGGTPTGEVVPGVDAEGKGSGRRLAPVAPTKIVCVGRNYRAHAKELGNEVPAEPLLFFKPPSSLLDPDGAIELPPPTISDRIEHEAELAVVLGRRVRRATAAEAAGAIFGLTVAGDITARDLQKKDGQWTRAKGMDTFCPVGPVIVSGLDPQALSITCHVGEELRQSGSTADMIFPVADVIAYASQVMTLEPGDLLLTGTPHGVGPLRDGDHLSIEITGIGTLRARVTAGSASS